MIKEVSRRRFLGSAAVVAPGLALSLHSAEASGLSSSGSALPDSALAEPELPEAESERSSGAAPLPTLFVGTQTTGASHGVYAYSWDSIVGWLTPIGLAAEVAMPTYLALSPDKRYLFAANEVDLFQGVKSGGVSSFRIGPKAGQLTAINGVTTGGAGTCYVGVDPSGRTLLAANYTGGSAASFRIEEGGVLSPAVSEFHYTGHGTDPERQEASHIHRGITSPSGKYAFFNDLGLDVIHIYTLDAATAKLTPHTPPTWQAPAGGGPRTLRFHPNGKWAYVVLEISASVAVLEWDETAGTFTTKQVVRLAPGDYSGPAAASECILDRSGMFAYASCRFFDTLVTFSVDQTTGELTMLDRTTCGGKVPRDITLDPSERWMLVANQATDQIAIIVRDPKSGRLAGQASTVLLVKPQCLVFA